MNNNKYSDEESDDEGLTGWNKWKQEIVQYFLAIKFMISLLK